MLFPSNPAFSSFSGSSSCCVHESRISTEPLRVNPGHAAPSENPPRCANCPFPISPISLFPPAAFGSCHFQSRAREKAATPARIFPLLVLFQDNQQLRDRETFPPLFLHGKAPVLNRGCSRSVPKDPQARFGGVHSPNSLGIVGIPQNQSLGML